MVRLFDLLAEQAPLQGALYEAARRVIDSGQYILGPEVSALEAELAQALGVTPEQVVAVSSGTDALILSLRALGVGPGDDVIVPAFSFIATASAVLWVGARPVFADIDARTMTISVEDVAARMTHKTKAVIAAHLFGYPADMTGLMALCQAHGWALVEDVAQALGARWQDAPLGTLGDAGALSFFPTKHLGALGDAGALIIKDPQRAALARRLRNHGDEGQYTHTDLGMNARMSALQAALLRVKLTRLPAVNEQRRALADRYEVALKGLEGLTLPAADPPNGLSMPYPYVVRVAQRAELQKHLARLGVESKVYYPHTLPSQPIFLQHLPLKPDPWPQAQAASEQALAIPLSQGPDGRACGQVITAMRDFLSA
jgi:dTDP-4-amino-4,6-dideoxygalactose transaminase